MRNLSHVKRRTVIPLMLSFAAATACESATAPAREVDQAAAAPTYSHAGGDVMIPFHGWSGYAAAPGAGLVTCTPEAAAVAIPDAYAGYGVIVGRITSEWNVASCAVSTSGLTSTGAGTVTFPNGDHLFFTYTTQIALDGTETGDITYTGGTGRYEGATGTATAVGTFDASTGAGLDRIYGHMTRPGKH